MPLTAQHAAAGVLDATVDPLGEGVPWEAVHRARPRAPLTCRECGHGLHAKVSRKGLRFFAHDRAAPSCSLVGETMTHRRLLKLQLDSAIRDAGWYAELEVAGEGWRADVLATSPDETRRMAWEAQLAQITPDELRERTARMEASGVTVCWDLDQGSRQLAGIVLDAAGRGQHDQVADLIAPLDADQLRSLVSVLAVQVDQTKPSAPATGPAAVCELAINAAAPMFGTTPEAILSAERSRPVSDARAVAMTAAREVGLSLPAIAEHFNKDHGSLIHAVRRTAERPRLADAAARVSEHVNDRYTARLPRPEATVVSLHQDPPASTFEPDGPVEHAVVAAAEAFGTTPEVLLGTDRSRAAADARAVAMTAARIHGHSLPTIARHFDRDHTTVLLATRRIEKTPPLRDLAAKIAAELPEEPAGAGTSGAEVVEQIHEPGYRSPGARAQERTVPVAGERPQLRAAR